MLNQSQSKFFDLAVLSVLANNEMSSASAYEETAWKVCVAGAKSELRVGDIVRLTDDAGNDAPVNEELDGVFHAEIVENGAVRRGDVELCGTTRFSVDAWENGWCVVAINAGQRWDYAPMVMDLAAATRTRNVWNEKVAVARGELSQQATMQRAMIYPMDRYEAYVNGLAQEIFEAMRPIAYGENCYEPLTYKPY